MNMDEEKVIKVLAARIYMAVKGVVEHEVDPLTGIPLLSKDATAGVIRYVAGWLMGFSSDDVVGLLRREYLPFNRWLDWDCDDYGVVAVSELVQDLLMKELLQNDLRIDNFDLVHGAGECLATMTAHEARLLTDWLTE